MSDYIPIEKGIPIPKPKLGFKTRSNQLRPWDQLEIGDSFLVRNTTPNTEIKALHEAEKRRPGKKFTMRRLGNDVRVWRIDPKEKQDYTVKPSKDILRQFWKNRGASRRAATLIANEGCESISDIKRLGLVYFKNQPYVGPATLQSLQRLLG